MTQHLLLLGAGYSKNWGGWLAEEVFEYLIGLAALQTRHSVINLLRKYQHAGGFEGALGELQEVAGRSSPSSDDRASLAALEAGIVQMFADMNTGLLAQPFSFDQDMRMFLTRFDAIYTLNQDILLERYYMGDSFPLLQHPNRWSAVATPGVTGPRIEEFDNQQRWATEHWTVDANVPQTLPKHVQPIFKLHGSSLWRRDGAQHGVLIIGGQKSGAIARDPLLKWYGDMFTSALVRADTHLMTIGYGFGDGHINNAIKAGMMAGLKVFNVSPAGADAWTETPGAGPGTLRGKNYLRDALMGASRRGIRDTVDARSVEHAKVMRFFR